MSKYAALFKEYLNKEDAPFYDLDERAVRMVTDGDNFKNISVYALFDKDGDNNVQYRCADIMNFKDNEAAALVACNEVNKKFRWVKFYLNDEAEIVAETDAYLSEENCGDECFSLMLHMFSIIDKAYVEFMKAKIAAM